LHSWGNVILAIYGQWHGYSYSDRRYVTIDLGLAISHDALHFHEPIPDFRFIPSQEERDRLGYIQPYAAGTRAQFITCPFRVETEGLPVHLNVSGLGEFASARVEVVDLQFRPLPGYSGAAAATLRQSGLRVPVRWARQESLPVSDLPLRLKVDIGPVSPDCPRPDDVKIFAAYVGPASGL